MISKKGLGRQVVPGEIEIQCNVCSICSRCLFSANLSFEHVSFNSRYLFGADLSGFLEKDDFVKLQVQSWSPNEFFIVEMKIAFLGYQNRHCRTLQGDLPAPSLLGEHLAEEEGEDDQDCDGEV